MNKRILIVGVGANQAAVVTRARELGLYAVAMDGSAEAPGLALAAAAEVANILNPAEIVRVAQAHGVDGIYPAAEPGVEAASQAAHELGLPGLPLEVAFRVRNKLAMRQALEAHGVPVPAYRGVRSGEEAEAAAQAIGLPVIVKPADANASKGVQRVDYLADMSLAFEKARKFSRSETVLVEAFMEGDEYNVDGLVYEGEYRLGGMTGKELSPPPYRFDVGIFMPPLLDEPAVEAILDMVRRALRAIGFASGTTHVEVMLTPDGPRIVEMAGRFGGGRIPSDLIPHVYGMDYLGDSLRIALGEAPRESPRYERGCAVYWIPASSGVVTAIEGVEDARGMPGVEDLVLAIKPGEVLGHVIDCVTRDRIGYVLASGDSAAEAVARAKAARDAVRIVTQPVYGDFGS
jgi:biotin carboxylase